MKYHNVTQEPNRKSLIIDLFCRDIQDALDVIPNSPARLSDTIQVAWSG